MISLLQGRLHGPPARRDASWWPVVVATTLTSAYLAGISLMWGGANARVSGELSGEAAAGRLVFFPLRPTPLPRSEPVRRSSEPAQRAVKQADDAPQPAQPDSAASATALAAPTSPVAAASSTFDMLPHSSSARLAPRRAPTTPWYTAPRAHNPFAPAQPVSAAERDSTLVALGAAVPELAARRAETRSERDARAKEAMLKMRLAGRILLVPPDNSGGLITLSISLLIFSGDPSKTKGRRDSVAVASNQLVRDRLRQRADSLRHRRADSLRQRREDSLRQGQADSAAGRLPDQR